MQEPRAHARLIACCLSLVACAWLSPLAPAAEATSQSWAAPRSEIVQDWLMQDAGAKAGSLFTSTSSQQLEASIVGAILVKFPSRVAALDREFATVTQESVPGVDPAWRVLYEACCDHRRQVRLGVLVKQHPQWVFVKRHQFGGSHYAYTEGLSDAQAERHFNPDAELCRLDLRTGALESLLKDSQGVIRDPAVNFDGTRLLFAWKKSDRGDDYHLYELNLASGTRRQLTSGPGIADYEGQYLPNGKIVFNSTRCVQTVDCWWTEVSNLYLCDADGKHIRRLGCDQVHDNYPTVLNDGRIVYTRWDYNDRGQIYPQPLCCMFPDGTRQAAFYGNSSWFPTSLLHARAIPGSHKLVAIASGHHCNQRGKLCMVDNRKGRQEAEGVQLIAPVRETRALRIDSYGQDGIQFQYPYPISETEFVVAADPAGSPNYEYDRPYGLYWVNANGERELLAWEERLHCLQPFPLGQRPTPPALPDQTDPRATTATCQIQDVYVGDGLTGMPRGTAARIRLVALDYRAAGIGCNYSSGVAGGALSSTPISIGNGAWDVKRVLGEVPVRKDGSACFTVPANTPVYFQVVDADGRAVQTMRSWTTFMPGETFACIGCHAERTKAPEFFARVHAPNGSCAGCHEKRPTPAAPHPRPSPIASLNVPDRLTAMPWGAGGFSFPGIIQPILDRHCVGCHDNEAKSRALVGLEAKPASAASDHPFSLAATAVADPVAKRQWSLSYLVLTRSAPQERERAGEAFTGKPDNPWLSWIDAQSTPSLLPPRSAGSARSPLVDRLREGHQKVKLSPDELRALCCWMDLGVPFCGDYREAGAWSPEETALYDRFEAKRARIAAADREAPAPEQPRPGRISD